MNDQSITTETLLLAIQAKQQQLDRIESQLQRLAQEKAPPSSLMTAQDAAEFLRTTIGPVRASSFRRAACARRLGKDMKDHS